MIEELEERFGISRHGPYYKGIKSMSIQSKDLKDALSYIENHGHFPNIVKMSVVDLSLEIIACRNNLSGRVYLHRNKNRQKEIDESRSDSYRQKWIELCDDILELSSNKMV